jgi:hypothetical protein
MANPEHLEILKQGVEEWNNWRKNHPELWPDLRAANLAGANLREANLSGMNLTATEFPRANLAGANLRGSDLTGASLSGATLVEANLRRANLRDANLRRVDLLAGDLRRADLGRADLFEADLRRAIFSSTNLNGTHLTGARAGDTNFADIDLGAARNLETIKHSGPSTIGIDTIYKSRGKIPEAFLRGCGVPDEFIAYIGSMVGRPIEFFSCFISYSNKDQEFAERLHADLQAKGVRCWFAPEEMKGGRKLHEQIDEAIRLHDKLLLILSEHSMSSNWVKTEIANAREREKREGKQLLFPITLVPFEAIKQWKLFDADIGMDSAREIREYFIPDFSKWKEHDSYQTAFQRLVKDLKAGAGG